MSQKFLVLLLRNRSLKGFMVKNSGDLSCCPLVGEGCCCCTSFVMNELNTKESPSWSSCEELDLSSTNSLDFLWLYNHFALFHQMSLCQIQSSLTEPLVVPMIALAAIPLRSDSCISLTMNSKTYAHLVF